MSLRSIFKFDKNIQYSKENFNLSVSFSIFDLIKLTFISLIIFSLNKNYNIYLGIFLMFVLVGLGFLEYMFIHLLIVYLILKSNINFKRPSFYSLIFFSYIFYFS